MRYCVFLMSKHSSKIGLHIGTPDMVKKIQWSKNFQLKSGHFQNEKVSEKGKFAVSILPEYKIVLLGKQLDSYEIINLEIKSLFRPNDARIDRGIWPEEKNATHLPHHSHVRPYRGRCGGL